MKKKILFCLWVFLYILCAGLGHIREATGLQSAALTVFSILFFVPGGLLLADALRAKDRKGLVLLRWISGGSLVLTLVLLVANVASVLGSSALGDVLYEVLILVSVPMVCSQHWVLSMFLWACLLCATFWGQKKK